MKPDAKILFVDGTSGAAGDMILGALVDLGLPVAHLRRVLQTLPVTGWTIRSRKVVKCALVARKIDVKISPDGMAAFEAYREARLGSSMRILSVLELKDRDEFMRILRIIRGVIDNQLANK